MPIKEDPIKIEFHYESPAGEKSKYKCDVSCDASIEPIELVIKEKFDMGKGAVITLPLDFIVEAVDFLREKGIVSGLAPHSNVLKGVAPTGTSIPIPSIEKKEEAEEDQKKPDVHTSTAAPFSSFAVPSENQDKKKRVQPPATANKIKVGGKEISLDEVEMKKRAVTRTDSTVEETNSRSAEKQEKSITRVEDEV
jgi:hypothetical protein